MTAPLFVDPIDGTISFIEGSPAWGSLIALKSTANSRSGWLTNRLAVVVRVDRVWAIMDDVERDTPWRDHDSWRDSALGQHPEFGPLQSETFRHEHATTPAGVVDRIRGVSHVAALPTREQHEVLENVR